jgi:Uma2 family endonuclease
VTTLIIPTDAPVVRGPRQGRWTYADWEQLPDDGNRYEIIDGVLYVTTAPSSFHQWVIRGLWEYIGTPAHRQGFGYPFAAPIGLLMPGADPVQPDFLVVIKANAAIIRNRRIYGVPDVIIEILSPSTAAYDTEVKLPAYAQAGVPEYAIIDLSARTLAHYRLAAPGHYAEPLVFGEGETIHFACLPTLPLPVAELFAGAPDTEI